ncbi:MAG: hypothetical protein ACK58L_19130 [Planctomycetota bacterium]
MPIRRSLLTMFGVLFFGSAYAAAQQSDSFADWNEQRPRSSATRTKRATRTSVAYFSPNSTAETESEHQPDAPAEQVSMRERTAKPATDKAITPLTAKKSSATSKETSGFAKESQPTGSATDINSTAAKSSARTTGSKGSKSETIAKSPAAKIPSGITRAAFESTESSSQSTILKVSGQADENNPFEEFLNTVEADEPTDMEPAVDARPNEMESEDEDAELLIMRKSDSALTKSVSKPAPSAGVRSTAKPAASEDEESLPKDKAFSRAPVRSASTASQTPLQTASVSAPTDPGPQSPGVTVEWKKTGPMNVGQECDLELMVQNTSRTVVRSVMTEAVIPEGLEIISASPEPLEDTDAPTWTFGELKPGETRSVRIRVLPQSRGDLRMDAFVRLTGHSSTEFKVEEPMIGIAVSGPETAEVGEQVAYVVRVSNPGTGIANNVVIQAAVPEGLEHRSGSLPSIEIGTLNPGESRQARLNLSAIQGGDFDMAVRATADGGLTDEATTGISVAEPKLTIAISGPEQQLTGQVAEFMLTIENTGNVQSSNVRAKYRIPEGCEFVTADRGGKYSEVDHSIEWFVGTLQSEESSEFRLTLRATETGDMFHQAGVKSELGQARMCDFSSVAEGTAALDMKVAASSSQVRKGDEMTWEVTIRNTGSRAAENVGISCELPAGVQVVDAEGPSEHIAENGIMIFRSLPSIEAGEEAVYTITTKATREGNQRLRIRVASESISDPLIGEESTSVSER